MKTKLFTTLVLLTLTVTASAMQIFIMMTNNQIITLEVEPSDSFENLKSKIWDKTGFEIEDQILTYNNQELPNDKELRDYSIQNEATLLLTLNGYFDLTAEALDHGTIAFTVDGNETTIVKAGKTVTVTVTPDAGYTVQSITGEWATTFEAAHAPRRAPALTTIPVLGDIELTPVEGKENTWTFTMEAANATFSATLAAIPYTVTLKEGTEDAGNWTITPEEATTTGVFAGTEITATYSGTKRVKSVKAVKKTAAAPAGTDLSMVDCAGNARASQWTANCYMVHTAGDYKLPLVYGNAIKAGASNTSAYTGVSGNDNATATFPRHDGQAITAPWIKDNGITVASAELLWQDAQGLVTAVDIDGDYLTLTVGKDAAEQEGNALVAAKDADGTIVWSWHIWVTKQTFTDLTEIAAEVTSTTPNTSYTYQLTPVNLGWVGDATSTTGYNTFYQWGRKDAFIPSTGTADTNHTVYNISNDDVTTTAFSHTDDNSMTIGDNIQHPTVHNRNTSTKTSCDTQYYNMWDAQQTSNTIAATATVKTVYDPCPPGFCVPTSGLYNFIASQNRPTFNKGYTYSGVFFPASGLRYGSSGDLGGVGTYGYCWLATPYSGTNGRDFSFSSSSWNLYHNNCIYGFPVRAVAE